MPRTLTVPVDSEVSKQVVRTILLAQFEFESGDLNVWDGLGDLTFDGQIFLGAGDRGQVSAVQEVIGVRAPSMSFELNGIDPARIAIALQENYQGRPARMWLGFLADDLSLIPDPVLIFSGKMDTMLINDDGTTATIRVTAENDLVVLGRVNERRYTPEDHKKDFPTDTIFDRVASLQDIEITWG